MVIPGASRPHPTIRLDHDRLGRGGACYLAGAAAGALRGVDPRSGCVGLLVENDLDRLKRAGRYAGRAFRLLGSQDADVRVESRQADRRRPFLVQREPGNCAAGAHLGTQPAVLPTVARLELNQRRKQPGDTPLAQVGSNDTRRAGSNAVAASHAEPHEARLVDGARRTQRPAIPSARRA